MGSKAGQVQETGAQRAQSEHAMELLQDYKQRWLPVQKKLASTIQQAGKEDSAARRMAAGKSSGSAHAGDTVLQGAISVGARVSTIDGVRIDWSDGFGLIRASNTTPVLVLRFEGHTQQALERIEASMLTLLRSVKPDASFAAAVH